MPTTHGSSQKSQLPCFYPPRSDAITPLKTSAPTLPANLLHPPAFRASHLGKG